MNRTNSATRRLSHLSRLASCATLIIATALLPGATHATVGYDIVYVRQPRYGDNTNTTWPEVAHPAQLEPGADLMLLHPNGSEEVLVPGGVGAVTDPFVSFDAQWVYYSFFYDVRPQAYNSQRGLPYLGADIFRINLATRQIQQLTFQEFTPNTGAGHFNESNPVNPGAGFDYLGYGILNLGPAPVAGGKVAFSSNRNGFVPPRGLTNPTLQLFVMDEDGSNVTQIAPMNIGSALHPTPLVDGRLGFSSMETQGLRDTRMWGIWSIWPDGRSWSPIVSAFHEGQAFHFMTQLSNEDLVVTDYYNLNDNGFGALYRLPPRSPAGTPSFYSAFPDDNPPIQQTVGGGFLYPFQMPFTPWGMYSIVPFTHGQDEAAPVGANGVRVGKFTHPSAAPNNDLLVVWSAGPTNNLDRPSPLPYYDGGLYLIPGGNIIDSPSALTLIKNDPSYNEAWPRAVVTYRSVHGVDEPAQIQWLPNDGSLHAALPAGTPYGLVGTSSLYKRESFPGSVTPWSDTFDGLDAFNTTENGQSSNWGVQGADAGKYSNSDIWAIRLLAMEPNTHRSYGPHGGPSGGPLFFSHATERLRILGEIPVRKSNTDGTPILDAEGNPDTSFLVKIPADTPFTFQTLDRNGMVLNMAQTWHQVRPGEVRNNCGGCHAHSQMPLDFQSTYASRPEYEVTDLAHSTPLLTRDAAGNPALRVETTSVVTVEFLRDIRPILQRSCVACHTRANSSPPGNLVLDDYNAYNGLPGDYARLADDDSARWGYPPLVRVGTPVWRQSNASRYIRMFQSRRSLLMWKLFGQRLDGWTNADHPTESVPGIASTLPPGADSNAADLDFTGTIMPPPGSTAPALTTDEKMLFARWIDLGAPIDYAQTSYGWFLDDLRPTLTVSAPRPNQNAAPLTEISIGVADADSGVNASSLSVSADIPIEGRAPGQELAGLAAQAGDGIYRITLTHPIQAVTNAHLYASVADTQGNITRVARRFSVGIGGPAPTVTSPPAVTVTPTATRSVTANPTRTPTATFTAAPTNTRTPTRTATPMATPSFTVTRIPTATPSPTQTTIAPTSPPGLTNDTCGGAVDVAGVPYSGAVSSAMATTDATDPIPSCGNHSRNRSMWYRFRASSTGTLTANTFGSNYDTILAAYTGSCGALSPVAGACNDDTNSVQSRVSFVATAGVTYYFLVTSYGSSGGTLVFQLQTTGGSAPTTTPTARPSTATQTFTVRPGAATLTPTVGPSIPASGPPNDACGNATTIGATPYSDTASTAAATSDPSDPSPSCGNHNRARSVWYSFSAPRSGTVTANTFGSDYDTILAVFAGTCGALTPVAAGCNDDSVGLQSRVSVSVVAGSTYYFLVTSYQSTGGRLVFQVTF